MDEQQYKALIIRLTQAGKLDQARELQAAFEASQQPQSRVPYAGQAALRFARGATSPFRNLVSNLIMLGDDQEAKQRLIEQEAANSEFYEQYAPDAEGWETTGEVATAVAGGGSSLLRPGIKAAERIGTMATEGGVFGALAPAENEAELAKNVAVGAGIGAVLPGLTTTITKGYRGIPGALRRMFPVDEASQAADDFARARGVPIMGEDVIGASFVRGSGRALDALDPTNARRNQLKEFERAMKDEFGDAELEPLMADLGESFTRTYKGLKRKNKELYRAAYESTDRLGNVPSDRFRTRIYDLYQKHVDDFGEDSPGAKELEKWLEYGEGTVRTWHNRMKNVSRRIRKAERATDPDTVDESLLRNIKSAVTDAINDHAGENSQWNIAQDYYRKNIVPYREDAFKKLVRKGDTETAALQAVDPAKRRQTASRADAYWGSLDRAGKEKYREALLAKMLRTGKDQEIGFSSAKAASYLDDTEQRLAERFIGAEERAALDGWQNLLRVSQFAGEQAARSRTGASILQAGAPSAAGTGIGFMVGGLPGAAIGALAPGIPALIARSRPARVLLAKLSKMSPEHPDYSSVVRDFVEMANAAGTTAGVTE